MTQSKAQRIILWIYFIGCVTVMFSICWAWGARNENIDENLFQSLCIRVGLLYLPLFGYMLSSMIRSDDADKVFDKGLFGILAGFVLFWNVMVIIPCWQILFGPGRTSLEWIPNYYHVAPGVIQIAVLTAMGWAFSTKEKQNEASTGGV